MSKKHSTDVHQQFLEDVSALLVPWGMPQMSARIYAHLLLHSEPQSLDQIAEGLAVSKSSASVAARVLEGHMIIRRQAEKGTKRFRYVVCDGSAGLMTAKSELLGEFGDLLVERAGAVAKGRAATRMRAIGRFHLAMREAMAKLVKELGAV